ncbi:(Fe-S)-binding protein [Rhodomicrobium lacus]|uniref:(Fe-S)-binding protein n=1 Tax=Rhodomicrobium lacus TaxID=2498452 RepID=UPI0026E3B3AF|nr:(Fe-S)-binding protein [Rhodomicrobium lacus]WKW49957.1 (Fe-S)-binding protein [Rhodomicrobium lacus]
MESGGPSVDRSHRTLRVGLLVTCLVDIFRPSAAFATVKLLEEAGCEVVVPMTQTCCGQPAYNSGDREAAREIAKQVIASFEIFPHVVVPSGSCASMIAKHYPGLFDAEIEPSWRARAEGLAARTSELTVFLADILGVDYSGRSYPRRVTYHDSCSSVRELGVASQPRALLKSLDGLTLAEMSDRDVCCGFGGAFALKYPEISNAIVSQKAERVTETGAEVLTGADLGCLVNIAGKLAREGRTVEVRHIAEVLAGDASEPGLCSDA